MPLTNKPRWALAVAVAIAVGAAVPALANDDSTNGPRPVMTDAIQLRNSVTVSVTAVSTLPTFEVIPSWVRHINESSNSDDANDAAAADGADAAGTDEAGALDEAGDLDEDDLDDADDDDADDDDAED